MSAHQSRVCQAPRGATVNGGDDGTYLTCNANPVLLHHAFYPFTMNIIHLIITQGMRFVTLASVSISKLELEIC